jgi:hypothetical protein
MTRKYSCALSKNTSWPVHRNFWQGDKRKWQISHEGENGPKGLSVEGDLPESFASIRRELDEAQYGEGDDADVDYIFEVLST